MYNERKKHASSLPMQRKSSFPAARTHCEDDAPILKRILLCSLIGAASTMTAGILLITILSLFASAGADPLALIPSLALAALLPSNFIGGFISAKRCGSSAFSCGMITAAIWCAVSLSVALCLFSAPSSSYSIWSSILLHGLSIMFCILGALTGGIKRSPSRKKRRFG